MQNSIDIRQLSREEKIKIMEAIWDDLSADAETIVSPEWHKKALNETKKRIDTGKEKMYNWSSAKIKLRSMFE